MKTIDDMNEFIKFCAEHTMNEIKAEYGIAGKNKIYHSDIPIKFLKAETKFGDKSMSIINDLKNGYSQSETARRNQVSRQYVSVLKMKWEKINGSIG